MAYLAAAFVCVGVFGYADDKPWSTEDEQTVLEKAEAGDAYCQATVARWLRRGDNGNAICTEEAYKWATRSAEQGNPLGMYEQQVGLRLGTVIDRNEAKANEIARKSTNGLERLANEGCPAAFLALGYIYKNGWGVPRDHMEEIRWLKMGAERGFTDCQCALAFSYRDRDEHAEEIKWVRIAAEKGNAEAMGRLGGILITGDIDVKKDEHAGIEWITKSVAKKNQWGFYWRGWMYDHGIGVEPDEKLAMADYQNANPSSGILNQTVKHLEVFGAGRDNDEQRIARWTREAAEEKADAMFRLGAVAECQHREDEAKSWFEKAADKGDSEAMFRRGSLERCNSPERCRIALEWFNKARKAGHPGAQARISEIERVLNTLRAKENTK
jgi:TPR repeat protein